MLPACQQLGQIAIRRSVDDDHGMGQLCKAFVALCGQCPGEPLAGGE